MNNPETPATQCPHCGNWIYTRLYYRQHVQECVNRTPAMKDLSDGALEVLYQQSDRVNIIRESELMTLIEQSDLPE